MLDVATGLAPRFPAVVQDPATAIEPGMPLNALAIRPSASGSCCFEGCHRWR